MIGSLCWRPLTLTKPSVSRPILPSCRTYCGGSAILVTLAPALPLGDYVMCLVLLQSRRHHQVQNQSHRTLDIEFHRQCLYQLHHRRLGTFLFSCAPLVELYFAAHSSAASVSLVDRMDWRLPAERFYSGSGNEATVREGEDKRPLDLRSDLLPQDTGFAWGHEGAGAEQLGLALLADALRNDARAIRLYREFTRRVIATLPERWTITRSRIIAHVHMLDFQWIAQK